MKLNAINTACGTAANRIAMVYGSVTFQIVLAAIASGEITCPAQASPERFAAMVVQMATEFSTRI